MHRARPSHLITRDLLGNKAEQLQNLSHGDQGANRSKIDTGHREVSRGVDSSAEQRRGTRTPLLDHEGWHSVFANYDKFFEEGKARFSWKIQGFRGIRGSNSPTRKREEPLYYRQLHLCL